MERAWRIVGSGLTKIRDKITKYYENIELYGPNVIKKKVVFFPFWYPQEYFILLSKYLFFFFVCWFVFSYSVPHCKRIESKSLCQMHTNVWPPC